MSAGVRDELLEFIEDELHRPMLEAQPHPLSEEHRRRLRDVQEAIGAEMALLRSRKSAEGVVATLQGRIEAGELDGFDDDAGFLGFRLLSDLLHDLIERAEAAGVNCGALTAAEPPLPVERMTVAASKRDRQEARLDEGIEETFPASDPVAAHRID